MKLSQKSIQEFIDLYRKEYSIILDNGEAEIIAQNFFQLMKVVYRPLPKFNK
jgi:hypothetical protein